jgi:periplasmic divalent cation tolerance protein
MTEVPPDRYPRWLTIGGSGMPDLRLVMTTCGNAELAGKLASELVERRLAACVNVLPQMTSTFRWKGKVEQDQETLVLIKTASDLIDAVESTIRSVSGYELPELIAVDIVDGSEDYLAWVAESIGETAN